MGAVLTVFNLCKNRGKKNNKTAPSDKLSEKGSDTPTYKNPSRKLNFGETNQIVPPNEFLPICFEESLPSLPSVTQIGIFNGDNYFSEEDLKYYKEKYANEVIEPKKPTIHNWKCGDKLIGVGSFGQVVFGLNTDTGGVIAVKQVLISDLADVNTSKRIKALEMEIEILSQLQHKNIVRYLGSAVKGEYFNILLENMEGGSIASLISRFKKFPENLVRIYAKQILEGLEYLHAHNVIHRDIKGANVLVDSNGVCKLADFGGAKKIYCNGLNGTAQFNSIRGTPYWMAPEVIRQTGYGRQADIWSFGCTVIEMATGKPPWSEQGNQFAAIYYIGHAMGPPPFPENFSADGNDFLSQIFKTNPKERANVRMLLKHPFITKKLKPISRSPRKIMPSSFVFSQELPMPTESLLNEQVRTITTQKTNNEVDLVIPSNGREGEEKKFDAMEVYGG